MTNKKLFTKFILILESENKDDAVEFILEAMQNQELSLEELYQDVLTPSLTEFSCNLDEQEICIWKEHTRTSIIRTILEATYPYVIKRKKLVKKANKKVVVLCPSEEYHEIGAIIVSNYFTLAGFDSMYIGANTPKNDIISAVKALNPDYIALSVTNYYNIVVTQRITAEIKKNYPNVQIIIGGQAFLQKGSTANIQYDYYFKSPDDILSLIKGVK